MGRATPTYKSEENPKIYVRSQPYVVVY
jgi:hypothetical protein